MVAFLVHYQVTRKQSDAAALKVDNKSLFGDIEAGNWFNVLFEFYLTLHWDWTIDINYGLVI